MAVGYFCRYRDGKVIILEVSKMIFSRDTKDLAPLAKTHSELNQEGNALVEFALCLPFFMIVTAGLMNLGSILWQIQAVSDAARYGARTSAHMTNFDSTTMPCSLLATRAQSDSSSYMSSAKTNSRGWWDNASGTTNAAVWGSTGQPDHMVVPYVSVTMTSGTNSDNCVLCFENVVRRMQLALSSSFAIEGQACS